MNKKNSTLCDLPRDEIVALVFDIPGFAGLSMTGVGPEKHKKTVRPVQLHDQPMFQFQTQAGGKAVAENLARRGARKQLDEIFAEGIHELHLRSASCDLHVKRTRKGRFLVSRGRSSAPQASGPLAHDRPKNRPLERIESARLLQALGVAGPDGRVLPSRRSKYKQINAFIEEMSAVLERRTPGPLTIVDAGCGKAYLTFAACHYVEKALGLSVKITGIDRDCSLIRSCNELAERLEMADRVDFIDSDIADFRPKTPPEILIALHACDTATDTAIAQAIHWGCRALLCAPCCHHALQEVLSGGGEASGSAPRGLTRHGILRQRFGDLLTDALRAQLLRVMGYRVTVREFVSSDSTDRNLMIRAERAIKPGGAQAIREYLDLRAFAGVRSPLELLLEKNGELPVLSLE